MVLPPTATQGELRGQVSSKGVYLENGVSTKLQRCQGKELHKPCSVQPHSCPHGHCLLWGCRWPRSLQAPLRSLGLVLTLHLSMCRERNSFSSSTTGTRPHLSKQKMWPQMWPTCSGSKQPRQQPAATVELGGAWLWSAQSPAAQWGWTGIAPVLGGTGTDSTVPPALSQPQQLWNLGVPG